MSKVSLGRQKMTSLILKKFLTIIIIIIKFRNPFY